MDEEPLTTNFRVMRQEVERVTQGALDARLWARQLTVPGELNNPLPDGTKFTDSLKRAHELWNAMTVIVIFGAIEGHIDALTKVLAPLIDRSNEEKRAKMKRQNRMLNAEMRSEDRCSPEVFQLFDRINGEIARAHLKPALGGIPKGLSAADRWEKVLHLIYLRPIDARPLPEDLRETLNEVGAVRNVFLHGLGRMDETALGQVRTDSPWSAVGDLVVVTDDLYRRYVAALMAYSFELLVRWEWMRDRTEPTIDLTAWREVVPGGT